MNDSMQVHPCSMLSGVLRVPGDKSISHRLAMLAALASGRSRIQDFLQSEDCLSTVRTLQALGADATLNGTALLIEGMGGRWRQPSQPLDMGNSGTSMRLLAGLLAGRPWVTELTGDASLCSRPMERIKEPLELMGAKVELLGPAGRPPIRITGGCLHAIDYVMSVASAQVKSCILLAALFAEGRTSIREPLPTRDHTERLFEILGFPVTVEGTRLSFLGLGPKGPALAARDWMVPGDFSSAAFWLIAAAAMPGARITIQDVGLNPRRTVLLNVLKRMGAIIETVPSDQSLSPDPCGKITIKGGRLRGTRVGGGEIPGLIDELPLVAAAGALADGTTEIRDARELRVKESDRIAAVATNLKTMGVPVTEYEDGMMIRGGCSIRGGTALNSYGDHRIAMAMAILALFAEAPVTITPVACVDTSYPGFWNHLETLGGHAVIHHGR